MAKAQKPGERPRKAAPASEEAKAAVKKQKEEKIEIDEDDPLAEIKSLKKEEIHTEAIPVSELKKAKYEKQIPGEFDFDAFDTKGFGEGYSKDKRAEMEKMYSGTVTSVNSGEVVKGTVVAINDRDVVLNIGFKSDGLVPLAEFKEMTNLKIGDVVDLHLHLARSLRQIAEQLLEQRPEVALHRDELVAVGRDVGQLGVRRGQVRLGRHELVDAKDGSAGDDAAQRWEERRR